MSLSKKIQELSDWLEKENERLSKENEILAENMEKRREILQRQNDLEQTIKEWEELDRIEKIELGKLKKTDKKIQKIKEKREKVINKMLSTDDKKYLIVKKGSISVGNIMKRFETLGMSEDADYSSDEWKYPYIFCDKEDNVLYHVTKSHSTNGNFLNDDIHIFHNKVEIAIIKQKFFSIGMPFLESGKESYTITYMNEEIGSCSTYKEFGKQAFEFENIGIDLWDKEEEGFELSFTREELTNRRFFKVKSRRIELAEISPFEEYIKPIDGYSHDYLFKYYDDEKRDLMVVLTVAYLMIKLR